MTLTTQRAKAFSFYRLPDELLLDAAAYLDNSDLQHFALTCRKLRPIAQEVLYRSPTLPDPMTEKSHVWCFLRTILLRPDLGAFVQQLKVSTTCRNVTWSHDDAACSPIYLCPLDLTETRDMMEKQLLGFKFALDSDWSELYNQGFEPALVGAMIAILPNMNTLHLCHLRPTWPAGGRRNGGCVHAETSWYYGKTMATSFSLPKPPKLTSFTMDGSVSMLMLGMSNLQRFDISLTTRRLTVDSAIPALPSSISTVTIRCSLVLFVFGNIPYSDVNNNSNEDKHNYIRLLISKLPGLRHLNIAIRRPLKSDQSNYYGTAGEFRYGTLIDLLVDAGPTLETLTIDDSNTTFLPLRHMEYWLKHPKPVATLKCFKKLRHFSARIEALHPSEISTYNIEDFFPDSIVSIEVMGRGTSEGGWLVWSEKVLALKQLGHLPALERVVLLCRHDRVLNSEYVVCEEITQDGDSMVRRMYPSMSWESIE
ncbi:hypothetical protein P280DRAFT_473620 [Massarina eburnea CBS 473.64]|uniref:F-box domain-containing protein n=1 Tax=Massarina eburnea CBS 473.64 TaxID=1395130 RepID=A0A6A6RMC8_9PLEO|nr:hypothetical protein P280DRAFT_473620 [Massarina eburnea CBS 473.64]